MIFSEEEITVSKPETEFIRFGRLYRKTPLNPQLSTPFKRRFSRWYLSVRLRQVRPAEPNNYPTILNIVINRHVVGEFVRNNVDYDALTEK